jgi:hypothetical protein
MLKAAMFSGWALTGLWLGFGWASVGLSISKGFVFNVCFR